MVQTARVTIPALAWGLNPPEWHGNPIAGSRSMGRSVLPSDFIFSRSSRRVRSPPPAPKGQRRPFHFLDARTGPSHRPVRGFLAPGLGDLGVLAPSLSSA